MVIQEDLTPEELSQMSQMEPEDERCKVGKCPYCGEIRNDLLETLAKDLRCAECDTEYTYCTICEEEQHRDDHCRYIFETEYCGWAGSGSD